MQSANAENGNEAKQPTAEEVQFFEKRIRPVLVKHCYECHSTDSDEIGGDFALDSRDGMIHGGEMGAAIVPGKPEKSLLLSAIKYDELEMPPDTKLPEKTIADFERWIKMGAPDPRTETTSPVASDRTEIDWNEARSFWSFTPIESQQLPKLKDVDLPTNRVDHFVLARMQDAGLSPNEAVDKQTLLRRISFDLTGLPPTDEETKTFLNDDSNDAFAKLVDRLLGSSRYGEHRARLWMDLARYAEDQAHIVGNNKALFYPNAYLYRDWLIETLNDDMPYDEFIRQQLAADMLDAPKPETEANDDSMRLAALGFLGLGPKYYRRSDPQVMGDEWEDRIDVVSRTFLGLTVACARCHDHKFDPITTKDYYALAGVFASTQMHNQPVEQLKKPDDKDTGKKDNKKKSNKIEPDETLHVIRDSKPIDMNVLVRGDPSSKGELVRRGFLTVLSRGNPQEKSAPSRVEFSEGSGRLELANEIANSANPLTARVIVNRIWDAMIGKPLVATPSNFGQLGSTPTHPQLLDDLAFRFMENGWSLKWLQREIALSRTYQLSSKATDSQQKLDPENKLLARANRKRLTIEQWRDTTLLASKNLDAKIGGPSINPAEPDSTRRTVYSRVSRFELDHLLAMFDFPDPNVHSARRNQSISPLQKMFVFNSPFMVAQADRIVASIYGKDKMQKFDHERAALFVQETYQQLLSRKASSQEQEIGSEFLTNASKDDAVRFVQTIMATSEFFYID